MGSIKILVLGLVWIVLGAGIYWGTCAYYTIKLTRLNADYNKLIEEFVSLITNNYISVKMTDSVKDVYRNVEHLTGERIAKSMLRAYMIWPETMSRIQPKLAESYRFLKDKYGFKK